MVTGVGDMTAVSFNLGFFASGILFAFVIAIPAVAYRIVHLNEIVGFWFAYIITRPLGASFAAGFAGPATLYALRARKGAGIIAWWSRSPGCVCGLCIRLT